MPIIKFLNKARDSLKVSKYSRGVILDIMKASGINQIVIMSTTRIADDQARIMYENLVRHGVLHQKILYGSNGDKVIDEYSKLKSEGKLKKEIMSGMKAKINSLGPRQVSKHAADPKKLNVIDIAPSSIDVKLRNAFVHSVRKDKRVSRLLVPPKDPAYHLEIPQKTKD